MKHLTFVALTAMLLSSCVGHESKSLILYYSQTGATEKVAVELQKQTGADIERFDVEQVYDGDFMTTIERVKGEMESAYVPALVPIKSDLKEYDIVYLAYPIWFGTYAPPVKALLKAVDFEGKTIVPVCTFGSGGLESSMDDLKGTLAASNVAEGFGIRNARVQYAEEELNRFLIENGYKEGTIDPLPEYSSQDTLTAEELAIYNEATAGYPFPMGEAVSVARRTVANGMDYIFAVKSTTPDGAIAEGKVLVSKRDGSPAEFTKVIR